MVNAEYRVAGDLQVLKRLLAANYPVVIEEASTLDPQDANGPRDNLGTRITYSLPGMTTAVEPSPPRIRYTAPDKKIPFDVLLSDWKRHVPAAAFASGPARTCA